MSDESLAQLVVRLGKGIGLLGKELPRIVKDPRAYPQESMLLLLVAVLALIFTFLIGLMIYDGITGYIERRRMGLRAKPRGRGRKIALAGAIVGVVLLVVSVAPMTHALSSSCGSCHQITPAVTSWSKGEHQDVACYGCHARPGLLGAFSASMGGLSHVMQTKTAVAADDEALDEEELAQAFPLEQASVHSESCLQCHGELRTKVVGGRVRVQHKQVIEARIDCLECHPDIGHRGMDSRRTQKPLKRAVMSICVTCHDGKKADSDCDLCHGGRPLDKATLAQTGNTLAPIQCKGCHSTEVEKKCVACHGLELPHGQRFIGEHAGRSWKEPALCARCHEQASPTAGCGCHSGQENDHGTFENWFPRHGQQAAQSGRLGCNCHALSFCAFCHETSPFPTYQGR